MELWKRQQQQQQQQQQRKQKQQSTRAGTEYPSGSRELKALQRSKEEGRVAVVGAELRSLGCYTTLKARRCRLGILWSACSWMGESMGHLKCSPREGMRSPESARRWEVLVGW